MNAATSFLVDLDRIDVPPNRIREADPEKVDELAVSFAETGQLQPIQVLRGEDRRYTLNIGLHRFLAAQRVGWKQIEAKLFDGSAAAARLAEIDENLYRAELTPYDQAAFLAERRTIYEALHGEVKSGRRNSAKLAQLSFFDDVTGKFGLPRRTVERALQRKGRITPEAWAQLRGTPIAKNGAALDALARITPAHQARVVDLLLQAEAKNVAEAVAKVRGDRIVSDPDTQQFQRLASAWSKAGTTARKRFVDYLWDTAQLTDRPRGRK